jgi:hypothetical protein
MNKAKKRDTKTGSADILSFFKTSKKPTTNTKSEKEKKIVADSDSNTEEISRYLHVAIKLTFQSSPIPGEPHQKKRKVITYSKKNKDPAPVQSHDDFAVDDDTENPFSSAKRPKLPPPPPKKEKKTEQLCIDVGQKGKRIFQEFSSLYRIWRHYV